MFDFHNHVIPGVDDGAADLEQSRAALAEFAAQGARGVIATPHVRASDAASADTLEAVLAPIDAAWAELRAMAADAFPGLRLERGAEVMIDTPTPDLSEPRLRLAGTRFVLVEFPFMAIPPNAAQALFAVKVAGWTPILAHPERYPGVTPEAAAEWKRGGALLQVNAGSSPRIAARALLERGLVSYVASDYHARGALHLQGFREKLQAQGAGEQASLLLDVNPRRLLDEEDPLPVPPLPPRRSSSFLGRLFSRGG